MFTEILRIKPVLDPAAAKSMERTLSQRFGKVAQRFGSGLKGVIKGTIFGISLGLLSRLLNPLEALEEKIKSLLGQSTDIADLAERFGTSPAKLKQLQDVAASLRVKPEELKEMLTKYAQAVEAARKEDILDPKHFEQRSEGHRTLKQFLNEKDLAEGFMQFMKSLAKESKTNPVMSRRHEEAVFGEALYGPAKRLQGTDIGQAAAALHLPSQALVAQRITKGVGLADQEARARTKNEAFEFVNGIGQINSKYISLMEAARVREEKMLMEQMKNFEAMQKAAAGIDEVKKSLLIITDSLLSIAGKFGELLGWLRKFEGRSWTIPRWMGGGAMGGK